MKGITWTAAARRGIPAWLPGIGLTAAIGALALLLAEGETRLLGQPLIEALVLALLGVPARAVLGKHASGHFTTGTALAAKQVLEVGVALLGASVFFPAILRAGPALLALVLGGVAAGIAVSFGIGRALGLSAKLAALVAVGNSICGNSAIAALAPVIRAEKKDVASAIGLTTVLGVCLVLALPLAIVPFALSHYQYGVLAGMSVYAVPQVVVAAAFPASQLSGEVATLVELSRVLLLGPAVIVVALLFRTFTHAAEDHGAAPTGKLSGFVPWFVVVFLALAAVRSLGLLAGATREVSSLLTILAMAGLGFGVDLAAVRTVGPRVALAVIASLLFMAGTTLAALQEASGEVRHLLRVDRVRQERRQPEPRRLPGLLEAERREGDHRHVPRGGVTAQQLQHPEAGDGAQLHPQLQLKDDHVRNGALDAEQQVQTIGRHLGRGSCIAQRQSDLFGEHRVGRSDETPTVLTGVSATDGSPRRNGFALDRHDHQRLLGWPAAIAAAVTATNSARPNKTAPSARLSVSWDSIMVPLGTSPGARSGSGAPAPLPP